MLTKSQIAGFKTRLEKERELLETELGKLGARNTANPSDWIPAKPVGEEFGADRNDNADIIEEMQDDNASLNELEGRLNGVLATLKKIDDNVYGVCKIGHEAIEIERLEANPAAETCKKHMNKRS